MNKLPLALLIGGALTGAALAETGQQVAPVDWLLTQIRTGESTNKYDLVQQSLYRLEKIDPDNPQLMAAQIRLALRQGDRAKAQTLLDALKKAAPDAPATRESEAGLRLTTDEGRQQLQQARLLATAGRLPEAKAAWDALFQGVFPDVNTALEYWRLVARLPDQQLNAWRQLQALEQRYPGNIGVELQLARMAFENNQPDEALGQLRRLANRDGGRDAASELWLQQIQNQPVSERSVASLQQYLQVFTSGDAQQRGADELARQQKLLADPAYRQRIRGLALVDSGAGAEAIAALSAALKANPGDAELMGAMGQAQARANNRAAAISWLEKAIQAGQASTQIGKWQSLLQTNRYWMAINNGDAALKKGDIAAAEQQYRSAQALDSRDSWALIGLGDVAQARKNDAQAEQYWQQALQLDRGNTTAQRRLNDLRTGKVLADADALAQQGQWQQAVAKYRQALQSNPDDIWLSYRLAGALRNSGAESQGAQVIETLVRQHPQQPAALYAAALWLSSGNQDDAAMAALHRLPETRWDDNMRALAQRLTQ
ncbi:tetratricopeptide repeat protein, partial [Pantoea wallisii]|uniref:tetratricopeptide repeat protein n=1 Tax=Pantoea wallisii TaxID=1076551 RepID=UPI000FFC5AED